MTDEEVMARAHEDHIRHEALLREAFEAGRDYVDWRVTGIGKAPMPPRTIVLEYREPEARYTDRHPVNCFDIGVEEKNLCKLPFKVMCGMILRLHYTVTEAGLKWPVLKATLDGNRVFCRDKFFNQKVS